MHALPLALTAAGSLGTILENLDDIAVAVAYTANSSPETGVETTEDFHAMPDAGLSRR